YISFVSTHVEKADARHAHVGGNLTMLGVTRPIDLNVEVDRKLAGAGQRAGFKATVTINRRDFGMNSGYPVIGEAVHLIVTTKLLASHDPSSSGISRDAQSFAQPRQKSSRAEGIVKFLAAQGQPVAKRKGSLAWPAGWQRQSEISANFCYDYGYKYGYLQQFMAI
ncbi:MAG: YceI family protein, partial [Methylocella sp.]